MHPEGGAYPRFFPGGIPREEWNKDDYIVKSEEEEKDKEKAFLERGDAPKPIKREDVGELE
ncbi:MAG: hypothetical protein GY915_05195 [bacterium]|nr:hypothetical protein [bacterium]